jgi:hypothetical protein
MSAARKALAALIALVLSLGAALFLLYPAWLDGEHTVVGDWRHPDMISNHWLYRWLSESLLAGGGLDAILHNDRYYVPVGDAPFLAGNGSDAVLFTALAYFVAWPASVTAWSVITVTLNGLSGYVLGGALDAKGPGRVVGALVLALSPYVAHELMGLRLSQAPLYWMALFLAAWIHLLRSERGLIGKALLAGVLYAITAFVYWYHGLWAALLGAIFWAARRNGRALVAFLPLALALTLPPLWLFLSHWSDIPGTTEDAFPHPLAFESSLALSFPVFGGTVERGEVGPGLLIFVLAGVGMAGLLKDRLRAEAWALVAAAAIFGLLALGPEITLPTGTRTGIPGPYRLVYGAAAPLRRFWWPYRHVAPMVLALLPLVARGADAVVAAATTRWNRAGGVGAAIGLVLAVPIGLGIQQARLDVPTSWFEAPPVYEKVRELPGDAMLELPIAPPLATSQQTLSYQWVHHKALVGGHAMWVDRVRPDEWDAWVEGNTFLSRLQEYERGQLFGPFAFKPEDVVALRELGVRHIVLNAEYFPRALFPLVGGHRQVMTQLFGEPVLVFRDQLFAWDLERYTFAGMVEAPEFRLPPDMLDGDGSQMLDIGHNRPQGWRTVARLYPPVIPPAAQVDGPEPGMGPVPTGPGDIAPHGEAPLGGKAHDGPPPQGSLPPLGEPPPQGNPPPHGEAPTPGEPPR